MRRALVVSMLLFCGSAHGGIEHTILHGVSLGRIHAWVGPDEVPGITTEALRGRAESALAKARIPIDGSGAATLVINAEVVRGEGAACFVRVEGKLAEPATLDRNGFAVSGASWGSGGTVIGPVDTCAGSTQRIVDSVLADFVEHYVAMNPATPR